MLAELEGYDWEDDGDTSWIAHGQPAAPALNPQTIALQPGSTASRQLLPAAVQPTPVKGPSDHVEVDWGVNEADWNDSDAFWDAGGDLGSPEHTGQGIGLAQAADHNNPPDLTPRPASDSACTLAGVQPPLAVGNSSRPLTDSTCQHHSRSVWEHSFGNLGVTGDANAGSGGGDEDGCGATCRLTFEDELQPLCAAAASAAATPAATPHQGVRLTASCRVQPERHVDRLALLCLADIQALYCCHAAWSIGEPKPEMMGLELAWHSVYCRRRCAIASTRPCWRASGQRHPVSTACATCSVRFARRCPPC